MMMVKKDEVIMSHVPRPLDSGTQPSSFGGAEVVLVAFEDVLVRFIAAACGPGTLGKRLKEEAFEG
jgi:hypothetical protein